MYHSKRSLDYRSRTSLIREVLRASPDGMTIVQVHEVLGGHRSDIRHAVKAMPDAYVDRWAKPNKIGPLVAVWSVVEVPQDCPHPNGKTVIKRIQRKY